MKFDYNESRLDKVNLILATEDEWTTVFQDMCRVITLTPWAWQAASLQSRLTAQSKVNRILIDSRRCIESLEHHPLEYTQLSEDAVSTNTGAMIIWFSNLIDDLYTTVGGMCVNTNTYISGNQLRAIIRQVTERLTQLRSMVMAGELIEVDHSPTSIAGHIIRDMHELIDQGSKIAIFNANDISLARKEYGLDEHNYWLSQASRFIVATFNVVYYYALFCLEIDGEDLSFTRLIRRAHV